jgi:branched-chain amino acid transport system permease protein
LFAFSTQQFNGNDFSFLLALTFVLMTVVGGAGSRAGVAVGAILFAILHSFLANFFLFKDFARLFSTSLSNNILQFGPDLISAVLLLVTFALNPKGLAQQVDPIVRWMTGGDLRFSNRTPASGQEGMSARP